jgi:hypothetical protein
MYARKTYSRTQDRKTVGGKIDVSREELADFKRKYGADKTLRDLLNYDRTGKLPGVKTAEGSGRGVSAGRTAADRDMGPGRPGPKTPAGPRRDAAAEAKGAETLERMKSRAGRGMAVRSNEEMRDEAKGRTLGALGAAATMAGGPMLGRGLAGAMERRAASEGAKRTAKDEARKEPALSGELPKVGGVFRSARQPPPPKPRIKVEGSTSGKYQSARDVEARRAGRKSEEDYVRDVIERGAEMGMKRGGTAKAYAKGGSVKGGGCETRSKKTRFI